jgi:exodeoxyribonuclease VII small subunit
MAGRKKSADKGDFETILKRLEEIVGDLEGGDRGLEESLKLFEEGVKLSRDGHAILDKAEASVQTLLESGDVVDGVKPGK